MACCTTPSRAYAPVAVSSFDSGSPKRMTAGTPASKAAEASRAISSTDRLKTPGIEETSRRTDEPAHAKSGSTKSSRPTRASRTIDRNASRRLSRLGL
jgi:hypothetical protein